MALRIQFSEFIAPVEIGEKFFPEILHEPDCWTDGVLFVQSIFMNSIGVRQRLEDYKKLGLTQCSREHPRGDYFLTSQYGIDVDFYLRGNIRVYQQVAWNPECPMGNIQPDSFPCWVGGFYYESLSVWQQAKQTLNAFNEVLDNYSVDPSRMLEKEVEIQEDGLLILPAFDFPDKTPYDHFFVDLSRKSFELEFFGQQ